jgi:hypothetical protein
MDDGGGLGGRFWGSLLLICLAIGVGGFVLFWFVGAAWARWGGLGAIIILGGALLLVAWIYDRRATRTYDDMA